MDREVSIQWSVPNRSSPWLVPICFPGPDLIWFSQRFMALGFPLSTSTYYFLIKALVVWLYIQLVKYCGSLFIWQGAHCLTYKVTRENYVIIRLQLFHFFFFFWAFRKCTCPAECLNSFSFTQIYPFPDSEAASFNTLTPYKISILVSSAINDSNLLST